MDGSGNPEEGICLMKLTTHEDKPKFSAKNQTLRFQICKVFFEFESQETYLINSNPDILGWWAPE